jgi:hypothetical protein
MLATMGKKKSRDPRNKSRHKQPRLAFHLPQELYDAFDGYVEALRPKPPESAVLRLALEEFLTRAGAWPLKQHGGGQ